MRSTRGPVLDWLLEDSDPAVRLYALTRLLGEPEDSRAASAARKALMRAPPVAEILALQSPEGAWGDPRKYYTDKYGGTSWQLVILAELGADGRDPRIGAACELLFELAQDRESGGFAVNESAATGGGRHGEVIPCLTGNMARSLLRLGYGGDRRLRRAVDWILEYQRADDGDGAATGWPYDRMEICFGAHSCFMGVVKSLKALAALPTAERRGKAGSKIAQLVEFMLAHRVYKRSRDFSRPSKPGWLKPGFPLMYQTDLLEILCVLRELGVEDGRMSDALEALDARRGGDGRWRLENSFNGKTLVDIERKGEASKWITARALYALGEGA